VFIQTVEFHVTAECSVMFPLTLCSILYVRLEVNWGKKRGSKHLRG
jgi:hypothetical protein